MQKQQKEKFLDEIESLTESYSSRMLLGTRLGIAIMRTLGFKRSEYSVTTPADKKGGWKETRIFVKSFGRDSILDRKIIKYREIFADSGFDVRIHVYDRKILFVSIERAAASPATVEVISRLGGKTDWKTIYSHH